MNPTNSLRIAIYFIVAVMTSNCGNTSSSSQDTQVCKIYYDENLAFEEMMFNHVKSNPYCPVYQVFVDSEDQYGNTIWKRYYTCTDFTKEEYEEMLKYKTIHAYLQNVPGRTTNERGNLVNKWTFVDDKEK